MRRAIAFFVLVCSAAFPAAEKAAASKRTENLKIILEKTFLCSQSEPLLNMMAMEAITESEKKIDAAELVAKFRVYFQDEKTLAKFSEPYASGFTDAEILELRKIYENPVWEKYSQQGMQIFQANLQCLKDSFKELALSTETSEKEEIAANAEIVDVTKDNIDQVVAQSALPTIIDVNATWCNACRMMEPIFEQLSDEYQGQIQFAKIDFDSQSELVKKFGVSSLPTILFIKAGQKTPVMRNVGFMSKADFEAKVSEFLKK